MGKKIRTTPKQVFSYKGNCSVVYRNERLTNEINNIFLNKIQNNPNFFDKFYIDSLKKYKDFKKIMKKGFLCRNELIGLFNKVSIFWPSIYAAAFIPRDESLYPENVVRKMYALRCKIHYFAYEISDLILRSLRKMYPRLNPYTLSYEYVKTGKNNILTSKFFIVDDKIHQSLSHLNNILLINPHTKNSCLIRGDVAFPGRIIGRVFVVDSISKCRRFKKGLVLVCETAYPNYISAIKKSSAIIANEGGITNHASVLARELKIPCIVNTITATKIFKDFDLVEVDANKGIVRKLK